MDDPIHRLQDRDSLPAPQDTGGPSPERSVPRQSFWPAATCWACLLLIALVVAVVATRPRPGGATRHPEFGRIRDTVATYAKPMAELRQKLRLEPLLVRFRLWQEAVPPHLDLEGHHLYWWNRA